MTKAALVKISPIDFVRGIYPLSGPVLRVALLERPVPAGAIGALPCVAPLRRIFILALSARTASTPFPSSFIRSHK